MRKLRNHIVHEYVEGLAVLSNALCNGQAQMPSLVAAALPITKQSC